MYCPTASLQCGLQQKGSAGQESQILSGHFPPRWNAALLWSSPVELSLLRCRGTWIKIFQLPNTTSMSVLLHLPWPLPNFKGSVPLLLLRLLWLAAPCLHGEIRRKLTCIFYSKQCRRGRQNWKGESRAQIQDNNYPGSVCGFCSFMWVLQQHKVCLGIRSRSPFPSLSAVTPTLGVPMLSGSLSFKLTHIKALWSYYLSQTQ